MRAPLFERYIGKSIVQATIFVLCGFLSMFLFFDFLAELDEIGPTGYQFQHAVAFVLLGVPVRVVELAPIAALIGTLWALSQSATNSEFTVFRVSGLLPRTAVTTILRVGLPFVVITAMVAEVLVPLSEDFRSQVRDGGGSGGGQLRSGLWVRDAEVMESSDGKTMRFVNIRKLTLRQNMEGVEIYEFDRRQQLIRVMEASYGRFITATDAAHVWELDNVKEIRFAPDGAVSTRSLDKLRIRSALAPETVSALVTKPDRMSSLDLYRYVDYLKQNKQQAERYEIALWKRIVYPFVIWVMMLMALPAAFLQARAGAVGARVFVGILIGVGFHLVNSLFSHLGILNTWPAPIMALLPSAIALLLAGFLFYRVQYR